MTSIVDALFFFLPAGIANMSPVFANKIPLLNRWSTPIDGGKSWRGQRLLGDHKTWRGFVFGTFVAASAGLLEQHLVHSSLPYGAFTGALLGAGALAGDALESFFKRRRGIASGHGWFPFDQLDYIIGGLVLVGLFAHLSLAQVISILAVYFCLHLAGSQIGVMTGLKDH